MAVAEEESNQSTVVPTTPEDKNATSKIDIEVRTFKVSR